ncbi:MAG: DNA repair protein [Clostridiales bacterium]|jgi:DNA polymerase V|nr:DNA repair protein [Clostridiales bacterium]
MAFDYGSWESSYVCIDLKSFYASVECVERGLDPMTTDLVVADPTRTEKTICLAVSPSLKARGVSGRARVFEIPKSFEYIMAPPRMQLYLEYAAEIYKVYLDYIAPEDMHVYSIDEVFIDVTKYLKRYGCDPKQMAELLMGEVYDRIGVRATAGVGSNMYLAKIAMDIIAKHADDFIGVLDEEAYKDRLWDYRPLSDFWRIGRRTQDKLERIGITTMRGIAEADEDLMYRMFGIDAELLIDHAYGIEPTEMSDIKGYKNKSHSLSRGQVLMRDYSKDEGRIIIKEMTELLCHELTAAGMATPNVSILVGYSNALKVPMARGSVSFTVMTDASTIIIPAVADLYDRITEASYPVRRMFVNFNNIKAKAEERQMTIFDLADAEADEEGATRGQKRKAGMNDPVAERSARMKRDAALQETVNNIRSKYGKDAMFRGMDLEDAATTRERNHQVGGHRE